MRHPLIYLSGIAVSSILLVGCNTVTTERYEASAIVTYTWRVEYTTDPTNIRKTRQEEFASASLFNSNGEPPAEAAIGPDDRGLWAPPPPPRPTVDEMESRKRGQEQIGTPQLLKRVEYSLAFDRGGQFVTLPTDYSVYRQAVKAHAEGRSLDLTLGFGNASVEKAVPR